MYTANRHKAPAMKGDSMKTGAKNIGRLKMKQILVTSAVALFAVMFLSRIPAQAVKASPGEQAFVKNCAVCHANGGNIINPARLINKKALEANGIRKPVDIVGKIRNPGPGMTRFDETTIPDKEARAIAEYILKTFK
jgi:cytochrome c6